MFLGASPGSAPKERVEARREKRRLARLEVDDAIFLSAQDLCRCVSCMDPTLILLGKRQQAIDRPSSCTRDRKRYKLVTQPHSHSSLLSTASSDNGHAPSRLSATFSPAQRGASPFSEPVSLLTPLLFRLLKAHCRNKKKKGVAGRRDQSASTRHQVH